MSDIGGVYHFYSSSNLLDWSFLGTLTNTFGVGQMIDPTGTHSGAHFYRAVEK